MFRLVLCGLTLFLLTAVRCNRVEAAPNNPNGVECTVSTSGLAFGSYNPLSASATTANASITTQCYEVGRGGGGGRGRGQNCNRGCTVPFTLYVSTGDSGTFSARSMLSGTHSLAYNIFTDATYSVIVGNGTGGSETLSGIVNLSGRALTGETVETVYGRIPAAQNANPGQYTDTLTITVEY